MKCTECGESKYNWELMPPFKKDADGKYKIECNCGKVKMTAKPPKYVFS